ncbi:MAG TPA: hypothetical protein VEC57_10630 [Candidatus Limnocylindrales bacterium]|nr:hypothetical protein [Candidatus Limnocylindrales bacterium]
MKPFRTFVLACLLASATSAGSQTSPTAPFVEPPFESLCVIRHFDEHEVPPIDQCTDDPLCVEYEKRDITVENGGAVRFLAAEPARFAIAIPKCRYWQQDHWRIQAQTGDVPLVQWDGSYWFNKRNGTGGARLRNFAIQGQPAEPEPVAALVEAVDPEMAEVIRTYGEGGSGGGGSTFLLGYGDPSCAGEEGDCSDDPAVAAARAGAEEACPCDEAASRREHMRCVSEFTAAEVAAGRLAAACEQSVIDCARNSTCGRGDHATVCHVAREGEEARCVIRRKPTRCRAPEGGSATVGAGDSCCDSHVVSGCE